jgi:hypothetical protein
MVGLPATFILIFIFVTDRSFEKSLNYYVNILASNRPPAPRKAIWKYWYACFQETSQDLFTNLRSLHKVWFVRPLINFPPLTFDYPYVDRKGQLGGNDGSFHVRVWFIYNEMPISIISSMVQNHDNCVLSLCLGPCGFTWSNKSKIYTI